ncbi:glycoside hydrolase family 65 [Clostridium sp. chh4-2]|nr:glycoside hydrolase family 65 [Clostridium sp. chh4-2]
MKLRILGDSQIERIERKAENMKIDRKKLIAQYNPNLADIDTSSPLTVGNGEFAFTADVTGLQSLYEDYKKDCPLCTMSQWGWHTTPVSDTLYSYTLKDLEMTEFSYQGRTLKYPKDKKPGNEQVYQWLRQNPHRLNLGRIGLLYHNEEIVPEKLSDIQQELNLYEGKMASAYSIEGVPFKTETCSDSETDTLGLRLFSRLLSERAVSVCISFPYGSPDITASDWMSESRHTTDIVTRTGKKIVLKRILDRDVYYVTIQSGENVEFDVGETNRHILKVYALRDELQLTITFSKEVPEQDMECGRVFNNAKEYWKSFWENGGMVQLTGDSDNDKRPEELQRRILLSMYLSAVNCAGSMPPQETGLICSSWYGKMHLEMHFWHSAWMPLWNHGELLERSMPWYLDHMEQARENAVRNNFKGIRWPKMVAYDCVDSPSDIAPLLIWQQPHIIFMLELLYRNGPKTEFLQKYWDLVNETAIFMADFTVYDADDKKYDLLPPIIPVQECHKAEVSKNPSFEVEYWRYGLFIAAQWAERLGKDPDKKWIDIYKNMREVKKIEDLYPAHENCEDTFTAFNMDHPSMLGMLGVLPSGRIDKRIMEKTLEKVLQEWQYETLWGWDFAVMAMTAARLGKPELAVDCLLKETAKNDYVASGNNRQKTREDLPLYLPGNGSLLLAVAMMAAGCDGEPKNASGFPDSWKVIYENINPYV